MFFSKRREQQRKDKEELEMIQRITPQAKALAKEMGLYLDDECTVLKWGKGYDWEQIIKTLMKKVYNYDYKTFYERNGNV